MGSETFIWGLIFIGALLLVSAIWLWQKSRLSLEQERLARKNALSSEGVKEAYRNLLDNLTHDISNPLQTILITLENMTKYSIKDEARWRQDQQMIGSKIRDLKRLTENAKLLALLETPDAIISSEPIDMKQEVEAVIIFHKGAAEKRGVNLKYEGPQYPPLVLGDREQLKEVLINLVENGIKYSRDEGGTVVIKLEAIQDKLQIEVVDNGYGIPPEDLKDIWNVAYRSRNAYTSKIKGTGLGLAIVKRIVEQHMGEVRVSSNNEGTTFTFTLPLYVPEKKVIKR